MIKPYGNKVLLKVEKEKNVEDHGGFKVVKTRKDSLLKGIVLDSPIDIFYPEMVVYFSAYGYEEVDGMVLVEADQIWAYERITETAGA